MTTGDEGPGYAAALAPGVRVLLSHGCRSMPAIPTPTKEALVR